MKYHEHALILGLGKSGEAAADLLLSEGTRVTVVDDQSNAVVRERGSRLRQRQAGVVLGTKELPPGDYDLCVVSPGIAARSPWIASVHEQAVPFISELELGWSRWRGPVLAVTGTNGKSTAAKWCHEALLEAGYTSGIAGNYGVPVSRIALDAPGSDWLVVEVSSFQLETIRDFRPDIGIFLNIYPNHLDRHECMSSYMKAKASFFSHTRPSDACIVHEDIASAIRNISGGQGAWITFGPSDGADYTWQKHHVMRNDKVLISLRHTLFDNAVMGPSAAGVVAGLEAARVNPLYANRALQRFQPLPHRLRKLGRFNDVSYINDSKATNMASLKAALRITEGPIRLIAGGTAKEKDFTFVKELLAELVSSVYLIGKSADTLKAAWSGIVPCVECGDMETAVRKAWNDALKGDTILLSPGCASFDQFSSYEERGNTFETIVQELVKENVYE